MSKKEENANKRLIFYFTSRVLFMIIAIILISSWCCMYVHADDSLTIGDYYQIDNSKLDPNFNWNNGNPRSFFNSYDFDYCVNTYGSNYNISSNTYHPNYGTDTSDNNGSLINVRSDWDLDNNYLIIGRALGGLDATYYTLIPKSVIDDGIAVFTKNGFYASEDFQWYTGSIWGSTYYPPAQYTFDSSYVHHLSNDGYYNTSNYFFCSIPIWDGYELTGSPTNDVYLNILEHSTDLTYVYGTDTHNVNYFLWDEISNISIGGVDHESSKNHLFLKDFQIGLSGSDSGIDIVQSNLICGVTCGDNFQVNNINDFNLRVTVSLGCSTSSVNVPDFVGSEQYEFPLATFTSKTFDYSMYDIFRDIDSTGVGNFLNYYNTYLKPSTSTVAIRNVPYENYTGLFPTIANQVYKYLVGSYKYERVQTSEAPQIDELTMGVTINLVDNKGNLSGSGTKVFNFLNGTNSVTSADILKNNDPWQGESEYPDVDPNAPSGSGVSNSSGGATAIAYGGNTTINVNNSNGLQNNIVNGTDPEETQNIIDRYTDVMGQFHQDISSLSSIGTNENNGFLSLLIDTYSFIPGLSYIAISCGVIFGLCVILFIIKVLLF